MLTLEYILPTRRRRGAGMLTLWQAIINFINSVYITNINNHQFTRRGLMAELETRGFRINHSGYGSMDQYRNILTKAGYIKMLGNGLYEIFNIIPSDLSIKDARNSIPQVDDPFVYPAPIIEELEKLKPKGFLSKRDFEI